MAQLPALHDGVPFEPLHTLPHAPQFDALVLVFTSQPLAALMSQSPKPALHAMAQLPALHDGVPFEPLHTLPQAPQFDALVFVFVSQPVTALMSQSPKPALHAMAHDPPEHDGEPFEPLHTLPQAPQFDALEPVLTSQPLATLISQSEKPALHAIEHEPLEHDGVPLAPLHTFPHDPQFDALVEVLTSQPFAALMSQSENPALHAIEHEPLEHDGVPFEPLHALPQEPQFDVFVPVFTSQPFTALISQSANPALHAMAQLPALHEGVPFEPLHALPHDPQFDALVLVFTSQPLAALMSQSAKPALHAMAHTLFEQEGVPFELLQIVPQEPQFTALVLVFTSQPFAALMSQLAKPALHAMAHVPLEHEGVPFVPLQTVPQAPQWVAFVFLFTSQPVCALLSQSAKPALQAMAHTLFKHEGVPFVPLHTPPQPPQWVASAVRSASHPLAGSRSQSPNPALQARLQIPELQVGAPLAELHEEAHVPQ